MMNIWDKSRENHDKAERTTGLTWQKNKIEDRKGESVDSPEIPDRGRASDILGLSSGAGDSYREPPRQAPSWLCN